MYGGLEYVSPHGDTELPADQDEFVQLLSEDPVIAMSGYLKLKKNYPTGAITGVEQYCESEMGRLFYSKCLKCDDAKFTSNWHFCIKDANVPMMGHCEHMCCRKCVEAECLMQNGWLACPFCRYPYGHHVCYPIFPHTQLGGKGALRALAKHLNYSNPLKGKECRLCHKEGKLFCSKCEQARYCSKEHQRTDWPIHRKVCHVRT